MAIAFGMTSAVFSFVTTGFDGEEKARVEMSRGRRGNGGEEIRLGSNETSIFGKTHTPIPLYTHICTEHALPHITLTCDMAKRNPNLLLQPEQIRVKTHKPVSDV